MAIIVACNPTAKTSLHKPEKIKGTVYGDSVENINIKDPETIASLMEGTKTLNAKIKGRVQNVCKKNGNWLTLSLKNGKQIKVVFRDELFTVPKTIAGKEVIADGFVKHENISVEEQKNFALETGELQAGIDSITSEKDQLVIVAKGMVVL